MKIVINIAGTPKGKGRGRAAVSRAGRPFVYSDGSTAKYERALRYNGDQQMAGRPPVEEPLSVVVEARFAVANSWPQKRKRLSLAGVLRPCTTPDADNLLKILDALNGVVWKDDRQIVEASIRKIYSERPGLTVIVETLEPPAPAMAADQLTLLA